MLLPDIDYGGRNHGLNDEVIQCRRGNCGPCDIGMSAGFAARFAMLQAQRRNLGGILAIRHRSRRLCDVLQAGRAGIGCDRLLRQQHEAEGAGGEPFAEVEGETDVVMVPWSTYGHKWRHPNVARVYIKGLSLGDYEIQYFAGARQCPRTWGDLDLRRGTRIG